MGKLQRRVLWTGSWKLLRTSKGRPRRSWLSVPIVLGIDAWRKVNGSQCPRVGQQDGKPAGADSHGIYDVSVSPRATGAAQEETAP